MSLEAEDNSLQYAVPGGRIGIGMTVGFQRLRGLVGLSIRNRTCRRC